MTTILLLLSVITLTSSLPIAQLPGINKNHSIPFIIFGREVTPNEADGHRTTQDIIWSCLATIFACTWVAIHPNLPGPRDSGWTQFKRKTATMLFAMLAPECITLLAMRQWIAAGWIVKEFNKTEEEPEIPWYLVAPNALKESWICTRSAVNEWFRGPPERKSKEWTLTHGFFVQMGGFILYDGETPLRVLTFGDLKNLIAKDEVDAPKILEDEINDKSKGDFLTKLVVVLQTTWFLFQCLARWAFHLPVTELEVVTLAFAALNIITYMLWWKKPQGVVVAVRVQLKCGLGDELDRAGSDVIGVEGNESETVEGIESEGGEGSEGSGEGSGEGIDSESTSQGEEQLSPPNHDVGWMGRLVGLPFRLVRAIQSPFMKLFNDDWYKIGTQSLRIPVLYADDTGRREDYPALVISVFFGTLHLIPWSSSFPSIAEVWLWRSSALGIIAEPLVLFLAIFALGLHVRFGDGVSGFVHRVLLNLFYLCVPVYIVARLILIGLAFATLRSLPPGSYKAIEWTSYIPYMNVS